MAGYRRPGLSSRKHAVVHGGSVAMRCVEWAACFKLYVWSWELSQAGLRSWIHMTWRSIWTAGATGSDISQNCLLWYSGATRRRGVEDLACDWHHAHRLEMLPHTSRQAQFGS